MNGRSDAWLALLAAILLVAFTVALMVRLADVATQPPYPQPTTTVLWRTGPGPRIDQP